MESENYPPGAALAEAERAATLPYTSYPQTPWWFPVAAGGWATGLVLAVSGIWDRRVLAVLAIIVLVAVEFAFLAWYRHRHGVQPSLRNAPPEFRPLLRAYAFGSIAIGAVVVLAFIVISPWVAAGAAFVLVTGGLSWYERAYNRAADDTRRRVAAL